MKGLCKIALVALVVAACGGDVGITEPVAPTAPPPMSGGILALGVDSTTGASIETNQDDYAPGEVVHVVGRGWAPGETVNLHMTEEPNTHADVDTSVVADASGGFSIHYYDVQVHDLGVTFTLVATGGTSGSRAVATFTDANYRLIHAGGVPNFTGASAFWTPGNTSCSGAPSSDYAVGPGGSGTVTSNPGGTYSRAAVNGQSLRFRVPKLESGYGFDAWDYAGATISGSESTDATYAYSKCIQGETPGTFSITATYIAPNQAPILSNITNKTVDEGTAVTFNANASDDDLPDPPGALSFSLGTPACANPVPTAGPGAASINPSTGQFSWPTNEATNATTTAFCARIIVSDGALTDQQDVAITVNEVNSAPVLTVPASFSAAAGAAIPSASATIVDSDIPANSHTFTKVSGPSWVTVATNGTITYGATNAGDVGVHTVTIKVEDNGSPVLSDQESYTVTIIAVNQAPVLDAIANPTVDEGTTVSIDADATDDGLPTPPGLLTFSLGTPACADAVPTGAGGASINALTGQFSWPTSEATNAATTTFCARIVVSDGTLTDVQDITIEVNELNTAPVLNAIGDKIVNEGSLLTFTATATDADIPANSLSYSLVGSPPAGAAITSGGVFTWTPTEAQGPGTYSITVRVTDNGSPNMSDDEIIDVEVKEVNVAPILSAIGNKSGDELTNITFTVSASDADIPANSLTYTLHGTIPAGAAITSGGVFTWTPTEAQGPGVYPITVRVTDNGTPSLHDEENITITVNEVNVAPVLAPIGDKSVDEGSLLTFTASASDSDIPANGLSFSLDAGAPLGASINSSTGVFTWTPTDGPTQSQSITIRVTDNGTPALADYETIYVTVNNVAPTLTSVTGSVTPVALGSSTSITLAFSDPANALDTYTASVNWDDGNGYVTGGTVTPGGSVSKTFSQAGVYTVCAKVSDEDGGTSGEQCYAYIVVFDPNGGFVTGGGWINSPVGSYVADPSLTGKANFGFVSKYQQGKTLPQGNTEFQFHAGNLNFKSTSYEWLVVSGPLGQYKGVGTINGTGNYGFLLTAKDGQASGGGGVDKFRIKIWVIGGTVVYDNVIGEAEDSDAGTALGGGSIVIHTKK